MQGLTQGIQNKSTFTIETHGCKLNQADALLLAREFTEAGLTQVREDGAADIYVVNSCTVTHVADRKARQSLRSARRRNPEATIIATGCYAERSPEVLEAMKEIDLVFGNVAKPRLVQQVLSWREEHAVPCTTGDINEFISPRALRSRAMVKIQEGCNQVCAYCIVPRVRGRERSIPVEEIVSEIGQYVSGGYREVVLTGTQLGSYGFDLAGASLTSLIGSVLSDTAIERLRVSSLQPREITDDLLQLWMDERLCPHFHIPLQSGSDSVLGRMRRRYSAREYSESVQRIRQKIPNVSITADVIVGFPGETEEDFLATYEICERIGFADLHVFPFSVRPGTSAAHYDAQVLPEVKSERMNAMLRLARAQRSQFKFDSLGETHPVLWESERIHRARRHWIGLTDNYIRVSTQYPGQLQNMITQAKLKSVDENGVVIATLPYS